MLVKNIIGNVERSFVKYPNGEANGRIEIHRPEGLTTPFVSIIIPTMGAAREEFLPGLLEQIKHQTFREYEVILVVGDTRQGRAINCGAALAVGRYLLTLDDDTRLGSDDLLEKMLTIVGEHPEIGMAGVANLVPADASWFTRRIMGELPRRTAPLVNAITESDLAEHPCAMIPRAVFYQVGGENELIPRGLDPYLRREIRRAGYQVVVLPGLFIHHLPPRTWHKFVRQFYRNGKMSAYVNKFYPEFVVELPTEHGQAVGEKRSLIRRVFSYILRLISALFRGKIFYLSSLTLYLLGYLAGYLTLNKDDV